MSTCRRKLRALLINDTSLRGHHGSALAVSQLIALAAQAGIVVEHGWERDRAAAEALETDCDRFDLVIVNGEGSVHHNSRSAVRIAALASDLAARGRPAYLVNTSVAANSCPVLAGLSTFRLRFVRDSQTQRLLAKAGLSSHLVHDLTLTWAGFPRARSTGNLLVTDASEQGKTARLLQLSRSWGGARMITFRTNPPWPVRGGRVSRRLSFEVKRLASSFLPASPWTSRYAGAIRSGDEIVRLMSDRARGIVCGRYHAVCFALRMFLPFISTEGNTGKIGALLSDVGLASRLVELETLESTDGPPEIQPLSAIETRRLADFLEAVTASAHKMFRTIAEDARRVSETGMDGGLIRSGGLSH